MKTKTMLRSLVVLVALSLPSTASATTYHLDPSGSDTSVCSESQPCRSIDRADSLATSGDTVVLHTGNYGSSTSTGSFDAAGVTWRRAEGEARPVLLGTDYAMRGAGSRLSGVVVDGAEFDLRAPDLEIDHNVFKNSKQEACLSGGSGGHTGWRIHHNQFRDCGAFTDATQANRHHCVYLSDPVSPVIENNDMHRCYSRGIQMYPGGSGAVIRYNTINAAGRNGILLNGHNNATVNSNIITNSGHNSTSTDHHYAIRVSSASSGAVIRQHVLWGNKQNGVTGSGGYTVSGTLVADPLYLGLTDFHLQAGSPAIGWGWTPAPMTDFDDRLRDADSDAGAYEYVGAEPAPEPTPEPTGPTTEEQLATMTADRDAWKARALKAEDQVARIKVIVAE